MSETKHTPEEAKRIVDAIFEAAGPDGKAIAIEIACIAERLKPLAGIEFTMRDVLNELSALRVAVEQLKQMHLP